MANIKFEQQFWACLNDIAADWLVGLRGLFARIVGLTAMTFPPRSACTLCRMFASQPSLELTASSNACEPAGAGH